MKFTKDRMTRGGTRGRPESTRKAMRADETLGSYSTILGASLEPARTRSGATARHFLAVTF